jgi:hypothetical protein
MKERSDKLQDTKLTKERQREQGNENEGLYDVIPWPGFGYIRIRDWWEVLSGDNVAEAVAPSRGACPEHCTVQSTPARRQCGVHCIAILRYCASHLRLAALAFRVLLSCRVCLRFRCQPHNRLRQLQFLSEIHTPDEGASLRKATNDSARVRFEVITAVAMKNAVFWDIKTQFILHRRHITSPLQSPAS